MLFGLNTLQTVFVLSNGLRFGWTTRENGLALALLGVVSVVVQTLAVRQIVKRIGEGRTAIAGFLLNALAYTIMALATAGWMVFAAIAVQALGGIANPAIRSLASGRAGPERQGRVMGALSAVEGATAVVSPILIATLFGAAIAQHGWLYLPGAPFLLSAAIYGVAAGAIWGVRR
jgi:DHA1 family tetracycline resistance protein-like MFS transporter